MIVDYDIFTSKLLNHLKTKYGSNNYVSVNDIQDAIDELKEPLKKPFELTNVHKQKIASLSDEDLVQAIKDCIYDMTDSRYERDDKTILKALCDEYQNRSGTERYETTPTVYNIQRNDFNVISYASCCNLYEALMFMADEMTANHNIFVGCSVVEMKFIPSLSNPNQGTYSREIVFDFIEDETKLINTIHKTNPSVTIQDIKRRRRQALSIYK